MRAINFKIGQRLISETEPELGIGTLTEVELRRIVVFFADVDETRIYSAHSAPLVRSELQTGDFAKNKEGTRLSILSRREDDGIYFYSTQDKNGKIAEYPEHQLSAATSLQRPQDKLLRGQPDSPSFFELRAESLEIRRKLTTSKVRGMIGPRVALLPHQFYVARRAVEQSHPRLLLADEVGLGKTIEAGLIIHQLLSSGRAGRVLIIVPDALLYQWYLEMHRRFNTQFSILDRESVYEPNTFEEKQLWITSFDQLQSHPGASDGVLQSQWDVLVVDEAHRLAWSKTTTSPEYSLVEALAQQVKSVLLLTATPEQLGLEGHFARLRLLDPLRFSDPEAYLTDQEGFARLANLAEDILASKKLSSETIQSLDELIGKETLEKLDLSNEKDRLRVCRLLVDVHGTGRIYMRNSRAQMEKDYNFFPKRVPSPMALPSDATSLTKIEWIRGLLKQDSNEKYLLICKDSDTAASIETELKTHRVNTAVFHESMSLLDRDRKAAYFADPSGAQILISSEIGSEGRNFQFAHHLILFDLPISADLLEQRIGRLDRIGQKRDVIIHIPFIQCSAEEVLYRYFSEGLNSFARFSKAAALLPNKYAEELQSALEQPNEFLNGNRANCFFAELKAEVKNIESKLASGRNRLLEINSFDRERAEEIISTIQEETNPQELRAFMERVFEQVGIRSESMNPHADAIHPDAHMIVESFPFLDENGATITYDRDHALEREDFQFITWDHPMVTGALDLVLGGNFGTASVSQWKDEKNTHPILIELNFVLECRLKKSLASDHLFPPTLVRTVVDQEQNNCAELWKTETINQQTTTPSREKLESLASVPVKYVDDLILAGTADAEKLAAKIRERYVAEMHSAIDQEADRLLMLKSADSDDLLAKRTQLEKAFSDSTLRLDSIRLII